MTYFTMTYQFKMLVHTRDCNNNVYKTDPADIGRKTTKRLQVLYKDGVLKGAYLPLTFRPLSQAN